MEEMSTNERNKASRSYAGMAEFSNKYKQQAEKLLTTAATIERGHLTFHSGGNLNLLQPQVKNLGRLYQQWQCDLDDFQAALHAQGVDSTVLEYVNEVFGRLAERIKQQAPIS